MQNTCPVCGGSLKGQKVVLPDRESNPGLPRDRRRSSPLDYRGFIDGEDEIVGQNFPPLPKSMPAKSSLEPCEGHVITTTLRKQVVRHGRFHSITVPLGLPLTFSSSLCLTTRTCGATDNALDYESRDCRFESCQVRQNILPPLWCRNQPSLQKRSPPGGLEPPTFRLTAERASRLRHGGRLFWLA